MARKALLIGTGTYSQDFQPLKSPLEDVRVLGELLRNPEIGGFEVEILMDLPSAELRPRIETWYMGHGRDDFSLLFLAGHGVKDGDRKLHFATIDTKKKGENLVKTTAMSAHDLSEWMRKCRATRQAVILNCCFSGAFGDLVPMDDGAIAVEECLGAEGRVVMTATSSMAYAFESRGRELSVYGHYLAEGLRTGAAATHGSDQITLGELHRYVSQKVQSEATAMVPQWIAKGEGEGLRIAKVALGDPEVQYCKKVERNLSEEGYEVCPTFGRTILDEWQAKLKIDSVIALRIENEVLEPIRAYRSKLQKYQNLIQKALQTRYPFGDGEITKLKEYQDALGLTEEDVIPLLEGAIAIISVDSSVSAQMESAPIEVEVEYANAPEGHPLDIILLESAKGINYEQLRELLKIGDWKLADLETNRLMQELVGQNKQSYLDADDLSKLPCPDLCTIDQLWVEASNGHFGFSVQRRIWETCGSPRPMSYDEDYKKFLKTVGWRSEEEFTHYWDFKYSGKYSPIGELPSPTGIRKSNAAFYYFPFLAKRLINCSQ